MALVVHVLGQGVEVEAKHGCKWEGGKEPDNQAPLTRRRRRLWHEVEAKQGCAEEGTGEGWSRNARSATALGTLAASARAGCCTACTLRLHGMHTAPHPLAKASAWQPRTSHRSCRLWQNRVDSGAGQRTLPNQALAATPSASNRAAGRGPILHQTKQLAAAPSASCKQGATAAQPNPKPTCARCDGGNVLFHHRQNGALLQQLLPGLQGGAQNGAAANGAGGGAGDSSGWGCGGGGTWGLVLVDDLPAKDAGKGREKGGWAIVRRALRLGSTCRITCRMQA